LNYCLNCHFDLDYHTIAEKIQCNLELKNKRLDGESGKDIHQAANHHVKEIDIIE